MRLAIALALSFLHCAASQQVDDVFVVFSNHVDIGYDLPYFNSKTNHTDILGNRASEVINRYFEKFFETAITTAETSRYKWMTQSWLVSVYRNCDKIVARSSGKSGALLKNLRCPNATALSRFEAAVQRSDITWHALPFNAEPEMFDMW